MIPAHKLRSSKPSKPTDSFGFASDAALQAVVAMQILFHFTPGAMQYIDVCSHIGGAIVGLSAAQAVKYRTLLRNAEKQSENDTILVEKMELMKRKNTRAEFVRHE